MTKWKDEQLKGLLATAFEGGVNYWAWIDRYEYAAGRTAADYEPAAFTDPDADWWPEYCLVPLDDGAVVLSDVETEEVFGQRLDRSALLRGLDLTAELYPSRWARIREQNYDAEDADVAVQLALFGQLVYG